MRSTMSSTSVGVTGRSASALRMPAAELSRSNGSLEPSRLTTTSPTSSIRSNDVYRRAHARTFAPATDGRAAVGGPGVDDAIVVGVAPRASHDRASHNMLWRREPYPRPMSVNAGSSSDRRRRHGMRAPAGHERTRVDAVGVLRWPRRRARIAPPARSADAMAHTVSPGSHDVACARRTRRRRRPWAPERAGDRAAPSDAASAQATTASAHDAGGEHVFDSWRHGARTPVRSQARSRTYVCIPSRPVLASPSTRRRLVTMSDTTRSPRGSSGSWTSSPRPSATGATPPPSARSARRSVSPRPPASTRSSRTSSARASCTRTPRSRGR